jgi:hypothetical protein
MGDQNEIPRSGLDLQDDRKLISPPVVAEPLYQCATAVTIIAFIPHATLEVQVNGATVATVTGGFPEPNGQSVPLPAELVAGQTVRARQSTAIATSAWSNTVTVKDHTKDYPSGPPRPEINPAPVYKCGSRTGVSNLLIGCKVWITADGVEVGSVTGAKEHQGVNVNPDYGLNQKVRAWAQLCKDPSPPSEEHVTIPPPSPLPAPAIDPTYAGAEQIRITSVVNGARFDVTRNAAAAGTYRTWGGAHLVDVSPPVSAGDVFSVTQRMCPGDPSSNPGVTTGQPCSALPAPKVYPVQAGDTQVIITEKVPGSIIQVYRGTKKVGEGGGVIIPLTVTVADDDVLYVLQILGTCIGATVREVHVMCVAPPEGSPAALDLFPVGFDNYEDPSGVDIDGTHYSVKGTVYYPAEDDGQGKPFYKRLAKLGPVPIVFMAHGNHYIYRDPNDVFNESCTNQPGFIEIPNHQGYDYFQRRLARMGIIAVSVYSNQTNCKGYSATNMNQRAQLIIASIRYFQTLAGTSSSTFNNAIDFKRVGLMGHSRGGEAVVVTPEIISLSGVTIAAVLSLAPTDAGASSGAPKKHAFLTILPAGDGDVVGNDGAHYYDQAQPDSFKCQLYIHNTCHNLFNRQWPTDESLGPPVISRAAHEAILLSYGSAFFRAQLLNHNTVAFLNGRRVPAGTAYDHVYVSFEFAKQLTVDHHEDGNTINKNSLGRPTSQTGLAADEYKFSQTGGPQFNATFFGNTIGMVAVPKQANGDFRSELNKTTDVSKTEIWVRAAEVYNGSSVPGTGTGFSVGLEDTGGNLAWANSDHVGGIARPYDRRADDIAKYNMDFTKTMLQTVRFPVGCFKRDSRKFDPKKIKALRLRLDHNRETPVAFDVLQIVKS